MCLEHYEGVYLYLNENPTKLNLLLVSVYPFVLHDNKHKPIKYQRVMEEANLANMLR